MTEHEPTANVIDASAVTIWIASFAQILPSVAAFLSVIWFAIRIVESETVQGMLGSYAWIKKGDRHNGKD